MIYLSVSFLPIIVMHRPRCRI